MDDFSFILLIGKPSEEKKHLSFGHCPNGGRGSTGIQKFRGSFVFPYFDPLLDIKWGEGVDLVPKVLRYFLPKFWVNI